MKRKNKIIAYIALFTVIASISIALSSSWLFRPAVNPKAIMYRNNFIQYLYYTSRLVSTLEEKGIPIQDSFKETLSNRTRLLVKNLVFDRILSMQLAQLIWLEDYYQIPTTDQLWKQLNANLDQKSGLFFNTASEQNPNSQIMQDMTYLIEQVLRGHARFPNDVYRSLAGICNDPKILDTIGNESWSPISGICVSIIKSGRSSLIDRDAICKSVDQAIASSSLVKSFISGSYETDLSTLSAAVNLSEYYRYIKQENRFQSLPQEIYIRLNTPELLGYDANNQFFTIYLFVSIQNVEKLKENEYLCQHINDWLVENYTTVMAAEFDLAYPSK